MSKKTESSNDSTIFNESILEKKITIPFQMVGSNLKQLLENKLSKKYEDKCIEEGFVKKNTIQVINYSGGEIFGNDITFDVVFSCDICLPVENMIITGEVQNITKAGIKAQLHNYEKSPLVIFISRDHHYDDATFSNIAENDIISVKIIGHRFELYDSYISVIAELRNKINLTQKHKKK